MITADRRASCQAFRLTAEPPGAGLPFRASPSAPMAREYLPSTAPAIPGSPSLPMAMPISRASRSTTTSLAARAATMPCWSASGTMSALRGALPKCKSTIPMDNSSTTRIPCGRIRPTTPPSEYSPCGTASRISPFPLPAPAIQKLKPCGAPMTASPKRATGCARRNRASVGRSIRERSSPVRRFSPVPPMAEPTGRRRGSSSIRAAMPRPSTI